MGLPRRLWQEMTTRDFADPDVGRWIAVLPVSAVEQHGPHLPVAVDAIINEGVLARTLAHKMSPQGGVQTIRSALSRPRETLATAVETAKAAAAASSSMRPVASSSLTELDR